MKGEKLLLSQRQLQRGRRMKMLEVDEREDNEEQGGEDHPGGAMRL